MLQQPCSTEAVCPSEPIEARRDNHHVPVETQFFHMQLPTHMKSWVVRFAY